MAEIRIKKRHPVKKRDARSFIQFINDFYGGSPPELNPKEIEYVETDNFSLILHRGTPVLIEMDGIRFPALKLLVSSPPPGNWVVVDMGAVPYVTNGADIMTPGIVGADEGIKDGDIVWIKDEKHGRPLAVGLSLTDGPSLVSSSSGKGIKNLHHIGDAIWGAVL